MMDKPIMVRSKEQITKAIKPTNVINKYFAVYGCNPLFFRFKTIQLKISGCTIKETKTTQNIPKIAITAIDFKAGCSANIKTLMLMIVMSTEIHMDVL